MMSHSISLLLLKPHTHAGKQYQAGETLDVTESVAHWLKAHGVGELLPQNLPSDGASEGKNNLKRTTKRGDVDANKPELNSATGDQHVTGTE